MTSFGLSQTAQVSAPERARRFSIQAGHSPQHAEAYSSVVSQWEQQMRAAQTQGSGTPSRANSPGPLSGSLRSPPAKTGSPSLRARNVDQ